MLKFRFKQKSLLKEKTKLKKQHNDLSFNKLERKKIVKEIKYLKNRFKLVNHFIKTKSKPIWMTIKYLPVLPPNFRPLVQLQDTKLITTDLNFLYSKIININNKILKLKKMIIPPNFLTNEKFLLQEAVDNLLDNDNSKSKNNI